MRVYPRLPQAIAESMVKDLPENGSDFEVGFEHPQAAPIETGTPVQSKELQQLRKSVLEATSPFGQTPLSSAVAVWDSAVGKVLHAEMAISPADASNTGTWSFLTLVVLPDIAVIRFPDRHHDRLVGTRRNVFRRLWWRAEVLGDLAVPEGSAPLGEDELVNIFERSRMARDHRLARVLAGEILNYQGPKRSAFGRKLSLRVRVLTGSLLLDVCSTRELTDVVRDVAESILLEDEGSATLLPTSHAATTEELMPVVDEDDSLPLVLSPYLEFENATVAVSKAGPEELKEGLVAIVEAQGPLLGEHLLQTYVRAGTGDLKMTKAARAQLGLAISALLAEGTLDQDDPRGTDEVAHTTFWLAQQADVVVRKRGPRSLYQIPDRELEAVIWAAFGELGAGAADARHRWVLERLDLKRLTQGFKDHLTMIEHTFFDIPAECQ